MRRTHPSQPQWESALDRMLGEVVQQGEWQDLKGKGQRLNLDPPTGTPAELAMAHKIMEDNNVVPAWIEERKRILARIEAWRDKLASWSQASHRLTPESHQMEQWQKELAELNQAIADMNIGTPIWRMEVLKLDFNGELERAGIKPLL